MDKLRKIYSGLTVNLLGILLGSCANVILVEFLARRDLLEVFGWILSYPHHFVLNAALASIILTAMVAMTGQMISGLIYGSMVLLLFGITNSLKLSILQLPFFAWDLLYIRQMEALGASIVSAKLIAIIAVLCVTLIGGAVYFFKKNTRRLSMGTRLFFMIVTAGLISIFTVDKVNVCRHLFYIENVVWDQKENYSTNGFFLAFSMNISPMLFKQPEEYDRDLVSRLVEHNEKLEKESGFRGKPISLIFFMSESFSDITDSLFESSENPLKNYKRIAANYPTFKVISPTYAGNTSLVEFEVLTGLSNAFLPPGAIPFDHYLKRPTPSLAWILQEQGYRTVAIHPFYDWFWNRNVVYPNLGFNEYLSIKDFDEARKKGFYISDEALVDKIIETIDSSEGPYFIHAVSMENHGPYFEGRYEDNAVKVASSMPEWLQNELESYLTGLTDADAQLARLLIYLESRKEPVICLFFGDHQPSFGYSLYSELGKLGEGIEKDYQMSQVPGLLWANRKGVIDSEDIPEQVSPVYLPLIVLHQMGIPLPGYMFYLQHGLACYPVVHRNFVIDENGSLIRFNDRRLDPYLRGLEVLNYDVLFGSRFSWQL